MCALCQVDGLIGEAAASTHALIAQWEANYANALAVLNAQVANAAVAAATSAAVAVGAVAVPAPTSSILAKLPVTAAEATFTADATAIKGGATVTRGGVADCPPGEVCVGVNVANKIDVALAVGSTDLDRPMDTWGYDPDDLKREVKYFEADLRELLSEKPKPVVKADLVVDAVEGAATDAEFTWWTYDHTRPSLTPYSGANSYAEPTPAASIDIPDNVSKAHKYTHAPTIAPTYTPSIDNLKVGVTVTQAPGVWGPGLPTTGVSLSTSSTTGAVVPAYPSSTAALPTPKPTVSSNGVVGIDIEIPGIGYTYPDKNPNCATAGNYPNPVTTTAASNPYPNGLQGRPKCIPQDNPDPSNPDLAFYGTVSNRRLRHPYEGNNTHMVVSDAGATIDFYGYPHGAFRDWQYLPNKDKSLKTFEFSIEEDRAFDALDGTGFFFNTEINGSYAAGTQTMSGYLLFLEYDAGVGKAMNLYAFKDVNTKHFHESQDPSNSTASSAEMTIAGYTGTSSASDPKKFVKLGSSTVYSASHYSRRIRVVAGPDDVKVYYNGSTKLQDQTVLDPLNPGYQKLAKNHLVSFSLTGGGSATSIPMSTTYIGANKANDFDYGFGPMGAYLNHGCARPTHIALKNLSMSVVKPLESVVRQPRWRKDTYKYLVNLNENPIKDFDDPIITGELLNRLRNDNIHYIGWTGNDNAIKSREFLIKNELKGLIVNIDKLTPATAAICVPYTPGITSTNQDVLCVSVVQCKKDGSPVACSVSGSVVDDDATLAVAMQAIAEKVYQYYYRNNDDDIVLTTDDVVLEVEGAPLVDTADDPALCELSGCEFPDGRWRIEHRQGGARPDALEIDPDFENWQGRHPESGVMADLDLKFNRPGYYDIYYENRYLKTVIAHRPPVANFRVTLALNVPTFTSLSYDLDSYVLGSSDLATTPMAERGITEEHWQFLDLTEPNCPARAEAGTQYSNDPCNGLPATLIDGHNYLIYLTVTDSFGASTTYSEQVRYLSAPTPGTISPPVAFLEISPTTILLGVEGAGHDIILENNSYDPHGSVLTSVYSLTKDGVNYPEYTFQTGVNDVSLLPAGEYVIKLVAKNQHCSVSSVVAGPPRLDPALCKQSAEVTKTFTVLRDEIPPTAEIVPPSPASVPQEDAWDRPIPVQIRFSDLGGSEFKNQRVIITRDRTNPGSDGTVWRAWSDNPIRNVDVKIAYEEGVWICWEANDHVPENTASGCFGPYFLDLQQIELTLAAEPTATARSGVPITLVATLDKDDATGVVYFYTADNAPPACPMTGSPIGVGTISGDTAVFTYVPPPGPKEYLARYCGDSQYDKASNFLTVLEYTITAPDLEITLDVSPTAPTVGDAAGLKFTVTNIGNQDTSDAQAVLRLPANIKPFGNVPPVPSKCNKAVPANECLVYNEGTNSWAWKIGYLGPRIRGPEADYTATVTIYGLVMSTGGDLTIGGTTSTSVTEYSWVGAENPLANNTLALPLAVGERIPKCRALDLISGVREVRSRER